MKVLKKCPGLNIVSGISKGNMRHQYTEEIIINSISYVYPEERWGEELGCPSISMKTPSSQYAISL